MRVCNGTGGKHAQDRNQGFYNRLCLCRPHHDGNNVNWFAFQQDERDETSLEARGVQTDFNEAPAFEPEFQVDTLRDRLRRPFTTGLTRDR